MASCVVTLTAAEFAVRLFALVRDVGPSFTVYDPVFGKWLKRRLTTERRTPEFTMRLSTNAQGFRQAGTIPPRSHPVLYLGDSFTLGYGVSDGEEFVALLQRALPSLPMLNAGLGDNGNGRWVKFLSRVAPDYEPRLVVLQVSDNDFDDNLREALFELTPDGRLLERPIAPEPPSRILQGIVERVPGLAQSHLIGLMRQARATNFGSQPAPPAPQPSAVSDESLAVSPLDKLTYALIDQALQICLERGWPVVGVSVWIEGTRLAQLEKLFARGQFPLVRIPPRQERPDLYYRVDGHWNPKGHRYVADQLLPIVSRFRN